MKNYSKEKNNKTTVTVKIIHPKDNFDYRMDMNDKIIKAINEFASNVNKPLDSLYFLYNGNIIQRSDYNKSFINIMNVTDKKAKKMTIIAEDLLLSPPDNDLIKLNYINITLVIDSCKVKKIKEKKEHNFMNVIKREKLSIDKYMFFYKNHQLDLNKKFEDLIDDNYKKINCLIINVKHKEGIIINFIYKNSIKESELLYCFHEDKLIVKRKEYCLKNNLN